MNVFTTKELDYHPKSNLLTNETRIEGDEPSILGPLDHGARRRSLESKSVREEEQMARVGRPWLLPLAIYKQMAILTEMPLLLYND